MKKEFHFHLKLTPKELWQFSMYHAYSGMTGIFAAIFTMTALFLLLVRFPALESYQRLLLIVCLFIFTIWQPTLLYLKAKKQAKRPAAANPMELIFSETGLFVHQNGQEACFSWDQIGRVDRRKHMAVIYMDRVHAYLIPRAAMGDAEDAFYEMVKSYISKGRTRGF